MIAYLNGKLTLKTPTFVYLDVNGVGYHVNISLNTYSEIEALESAKIYTYLMIREDSHTLYGFFTEEERNLFTLLISVSGIGGNTGRVILSYLSPSEVNSAILSENVAVFNKVKGIGPKTAKRIILDLKDKIAKIADDSKVEIVSNTSMNTKAEAMSALQSLGFQKTIIEKKLDHVMKSADSSFTVEDIIKEVLRQLS
jgi:Holliday junction DNA helicase RuvA